MLFEFNFRIKYIPGETNRADGSSHISIHNPSISTGNVEKYIVTRIKNRAITLGGIQIYSC